MSLINGSQRIYKITAKLSIEEITNIEYYVKGAVYSYCNNKLSDATNSDWFATYNLFGEKNYYWQDPIYKIYDWHIKQGCTNKQAFDKAGKDIGWILKSVLKQDKTREYEQDSIQRQH